MHVLIAAQFYLQLRSVTQCDRAPNAPPAMTHTDMTTVINNFFMYGND